MQLLLPVVDEGRGTHDQRRPRLLLRVDLVVVGQKDRDGLQCFAQSHIICQNTAEPVRVQHPHPAVARDLVFAQDFPELYRHVEIRVGDGLELLDQLLEFRVALRVDVLHGLHHLVDVERAESRDVHLAGEQFLGRDLQRIHELDQLFQLLVLIEPQEIPVLQADELLRLPVSADCCHDLLGTEFIRSEFHCEQALGEGDARVEGHTAPDLQAHEALRRPDFAHCHELIKAAVEEGEQCLIVAGRHKDLLHGILLRHIAGQEIHERGLRLDVAVVLRLSLTVSPVVAVKGAVVLLSVVDRGLAKHSVLIDVQVADEFRLRGDIFPDQLRPDLRKIRRFPQLRKGLPVEVRDRRPPDIKVDLPRVRGHIDQGADLLRLLAADPHQFRVLPFHVQAVIVVGASDHRRDLPAELHAVKGLLLPGKHRFQREPGGDSAFRRHLYRQFIVRVLRVHKEGIRLARHLYFVALRERSLIERVQNTADQRDLIRQLHPAVHL